MDIDVINPFAAIQDSPENLKALDDAASIIEKSEQKPDEIEREEENPVDKGLTEKEKGAPKSLIWKNLRAQMGEDDSSEEDEEESEGDTDENDPEDKKDGDKPDEGGDKEDEEIAKLTADDLVRKDGKPVSSQTRQRFDDLKKVLTKKVNRVKELEAEINKLRSEFSPEIKEKIQKAEELEKKVQELQSKVNTFEFQETEEFKQAYVEPIIDSRKKIDEFINDYVEESERLAVKALLLDAEKHATKKNEHKFVDIAEDIAEKYVDGSQLKKNRFLRMMEEYYSRTASYADAFTKADAERRKEVSRRLSENRSSSIRRIVDSVGEFVKNFEVSKRPILDALPESYRDEFISSYRNKEKELRDHLSDFAATGKASDNLLEVISRGIVSYSVEKENQMAWKAYKALSDKFKQVKDELDEYKRKMKVVSKGPSKSTDHYSSGNSTKDKAKEFKSGRSIIYEKLQESLKN